MKKISLILVLMFLTMITTLSAETTTIGLIGTSVATELTGSMGKIEVQVGYDYTPALSLSADYTLIGERLTLGSTPGFFWGVGVGPFVNLSPGGSNIGIFAPFEFGFNIPELLENRFDIYIQLAPRYKIAPSLGFNFTGGVGIRFRL